MVDFLKAENEMKKYVSEFDLNNENIRRKIRHTYSVVNTSENLAKGLNLELEDIELAKLIALLHDIGRFEQLKRYNSYLDYLTVDHGDLGAQILLENDYIRKFIETDKYDDIIIKAIKNHNKYEINEKDFTEKELLHAKLIRDSDKIDNFYIKINRDVVVTDEDIISEKVFDCVRNKRKVLNSDRKSELDIRVSIIGWIYDLNFNCSFEIVKKENLVDKLFSTIKNANRKTKEQLEELRKIGNEYVDEKLNLI